MEVKVFKIDDKDYYSLGELPIDDNIYYMLINKDDNDDVLVRKVTKDDPEHLSPLDNEEEVMNVLDKFDTLDE